MPALSNGRLRRRNSDAEMSVYRVTDLVTNSSVEAMWRCVIKDTHVSSLEVRKACRKNQTRNTTAPNNSTLFSLGWRNLLTAASHLKHLFIDTRPRDSAQVHIFHSSSRTGKFSHLKISHSYVSVVCVCVCQRCVCLYVFVCVCMYYLCVFVTACQYHSCCDRGCQHVNQTWGYFTLEYWFDFHILFICAYQNGQYDQCQNMIIFQILKIMRKAWSWLMLHETKADTHPS